MTAPEYQIAEGDGARVDYTEQDAAFVDVTLEHLASAIELLTGYFELSAPFPTIRAVLVPDRPEFDRCVKEILHIEIEVPSNPCRIAQPQRTDLVLLSPNAYGESTTTYTPEGYRRLIMHETVHIFEEYLSPDMEKTPRWWSEGLAMYLSRDWEYDEQPRVLEAIRAGRIPSIAEMQTGAVASEGVKLCYLWGWTIVMFIDQTYGTQMIRKIVAECDDGDVFAIVQEDPQAFEVQWKNWLRDIAKAQHCEGTFDRIKPS